MAVLRGQGLFSWRKWASKAAFSGGSMGKNPFPTAGDFGSIPGSGRSSLEKEMAAHSSILAWEIPWTEEPPLSTRLSRAELSDTHTAVCAHSELGRVAGLLAGEDTGMSKVVAQVS